MGGACICIELTAIEELNATAENKTWCDTISFKQKLRTCVKFKQSFLSMI